MKTLVVGKWSEEALKWLAEHGATLHQHNELQIIEIPEDLEVDEDPTTLHCETISAYDESRSLIPTHVNFQQHPDVFETAIRLYPQFTGGCHTDLEDPDVKPRILNAAEKQQAIEQMYAQFYDWLDAAQETSPVPRRSMEDLCLFRNDHLSPLINSLWRKCSEP